MASETEVVKPGSRLRCEQCGAEAVVVRSDQPELQCCNAAMTVIFAGKPKA